MTAKADQKERTHAAILASAGRLLRERGIDGATVSEVMKGAGLTVGGFYAHFPSKEALVDGALRQAGEEGRAALFSGVEEADRPVVLIRRYLSRAHRDDPSAGCPMPAVVGGVATGAPEHAGAIADLIGAMADEIGGERQTALATAALMYGGLALARATRGTPLSDELLAACRAVAAKLPEP